MIVVDTNVIAALWLPTPTSDVAEQVLRHDAHWSVPLLWRSEFRSVLAAYLRRGLLDATRASAIAEGAETQLRGGEYLVPSHDVLQLVAMSRCSAYDCEFVALAQQLSVPLVTHDREILGAFPKVAKSPERFLP